MLSTPYFRRLTRVGGANYIYHRLGRFASSETVAAFHASGRNLGMGGQHIQ